MTEYRPHSFTDPTLASGSEALPPEGTSGSGITGYASVLRMAGNGETYSFDDTRHQGTDGGASPGSKASFHLDTTSPREVRNHGV